MPQMNSSSWVFDYLLLSTLWLIFSTKIFWSSIVSFKNSNFILKKNFFILII